VSKTHRYHVTETGRLVIAAIQTIQQASMAVLPRVARIGRELERN